MPEATGSHAVSRSTRRVASFSAAALLVGATVSGCAAGFDAFTNQPYTPSNGSVASVGDIRVRNVVLVQSTDGGLSELYASFVNVGANPDTVVGVNIARFGDLPLTDGPITIPPFTKVDVGPNGFRLFANGLKLKPGEIATVTFRFATAGNTYLSALLMTPSGLVSGG
jgi:hypothetical protein